ncbi:MAG: NUDIX domain-containing protein [Rhodothermales bacterium]|nr:NUDIX domain-containing protein [Rhodothermales bacterium]MBO6778833.1 NUDIX domain-containing protein [Rhodothermales bacterium]
MAKAPFLFYPVGKEELKAIAKEGLDPERPHFDRLKSARKHKGVVLVVPQKARDKGRIRPKHIVNLRPLRRAVRVLAGGGVLLREKKGRVETVLIFRRGRWDIPKGKKDRGESKRACAVREVQEELGIDYARILWKVGVTTHGYRARKRRYLIKHTHWYAMETNAKQFIPQAKEQITDARWVSLDEAIEMVEFRALRTLLTEARSQLSGKRSRRHRL